MVTFYFSFLQLLLFDVLLQELSLLLCICLLAYLYQYEFVNIYSILYVDNPKLLFLILFSSKSTVPELTISRSFRLAPVSFQLAPDLEHFVTFWRKMLQVDLVFPSPDLKSITPRNSGFILYLETKIWPLSQQFYFDYNIFGMLLGAIFYYHQLVRMLTKIWLWPLSMMHYELPFPWNCYFL